MNALELCIKAAENIQGFKSIALTDSTPVFGDGCPLDSLEFVDYCLAIEREARAEGHEITLVDPQLFLSPDQPYRTIGGIAKLVAALIGDTVVLDETGEMWNYMPHPDIQLTPKTEPVKILFCDLDETLWTGVAGEDDIEPRKDILDHVYRLQAAGVLLGIVTRNHKAIIDETPHSKYKGPPIDRDRFLVQMYGVEDKGSAIKDCLKEINLTEHNAAVIDDSPHELDRIKNSLPNIQCLLPEDVIQIPIPSGTDMARTELYVQEYTRRKSRDEYGGYMDWLASLGMVLSIRHPADESEKARAAELLERANQFNFSRRQEYVLMPDMKEYVAQLSDKFGDSGIVAVMRVQGNNLHDFAVSCRVLGRGVEETLLKWARAHGIKSFAIQIDERNLAAQEFVARYKGKGSEIDKCSYPIQIK